MTNSDLEVTSNFDAALHTAPLPPPDSSVQHVGDAQTLPYLAAQPTGDALNQPAMDTNSTVQA